MESDSRARFINNAHFYDEVIAGNDHIKKCLADPSRILHTEERLHTDEPTVFSIKFYDILVKRINPLFEYIIMNFSKICDVSIFWHYC